MMQILFLSDGWMAALFFILWPALQLSAALLCLKLPDRCLSPGCFLFRERAWEQGGRFYEKVFRVRKWKGFLPDGGALFKSGFRKKHLTDCSAENLERFVTETCRAELTHLLAVLPFWVFGLVAPPFIIPCMLVYALAVNLPCMIAQRYNRIRLLAVLRRKAVRGDGKPRLKKENIRRSPAEQAEN